MGMGLRAKKPAAAKAGARHPTRLTPLEAALARHVLETVPSIIYVYDVKLERNVFQNRRLSELLGGAPSDAQAASEWTNYLHPDDAPRFPAHRKRLKAIRAGQALSWEFRLRHKDGDWRWFNTSDVLLEADRSGAPRLIVGSAADITEQKKIDEHKDVLLGEMRHRARNATTMIEAIGRQTLPRDQPEVEAYFKSYAARLRALFSAGEVVLSSSARLADMRALLESALEPFRVNGEKSRIELEGPAIEITEQVAGSLALAVHELATNASKYGALSGSNGSVSLKWDVSRGRIRLDWKEKNGPPVAKPSHEGFGTRVIRHVARRESGGAVDLAYNPDGVRCRFEFSVSS
jgi:PAS domain S-box-containing protein